MSKPKRQRPHGKNRTVKYTLRMTPNVSRRVNAEARKRNITACDWINEQISEPVTKN